MTTTPLMGLVTPADQGSFGVWAPILQTLFDRVDLHNHTTGLGAKVPTGGLNIDADLSFSPSGTPRAITDLKAVDFAAVAASAVTGLAGAFFLSDGSGGLVVNELYYRTTSGSNVRVTAGAALNVGAFVGGIGGDYSSVGALLDYDDATDTYRFRQETAAAVRQFAKMRCADIQLVEYDPSGDATVPANAVTLKSPDALAAAYDVTWPAALPAGKTIVQLDAGGVLSAGLAVPAATSYVTMSSAGTLGTTPVATTWQHSPALVSLSDATAALVAGAFGGGVAPRVALNTSTGPHSFPLSIPIGTITAFSVHCHKSSAAGTLSAKLVESASGIGVGGLTQIGSTQSNSANNPGDITLGQSGLSFVMTAGRQYYIEVIGGGTTGDNVGPYSATVNPP